MQNKTSYTTYKIILPRLLGLKRKLQLICQNDNLIYCAPFIETYRQNVESRFKNYFVLNAVEAEYAAVAALSYYTCFKNE